MVNNCNAFEVFLDCSLQKKLFSLLDAISWCNFHTRRLPEPNRAIWLQSIIIVESQQHFPHLSPRLQAHLRSLSRQLDIEPLRLWARRGNRSRLLGLLTNKQRQ
jgi:hypothetical protein